MTRRSSRVGFTFGAITAVVLTCLILYSLIAGLSGSQTLLLTIGCLIAVWAILFSFFEVRRLALRSKSIGGEASDFDPDASRKVSVEPPTGEATPHHEVHLGSEGLDQGQLTSRLPDTIAGWLGRDRDKKKAF